MAPKRNQPELDAGVREYFEATREDDYERPEMENEETSEESHGRIEHRSYRKKRIRAALSDAFRDSL